MQLSPEMLGVEPVKTLILFRHGLFGGNTYAHLEGEAAMAAVERGFRRDDYHDWGLLPEGKDQAVLIREALAKFAIDVCLHSPARRTKETAEIVFAKRPEVVLTEEPDLIERDRGRFAFMPDWWSHQQPSYAERRKSRIHWRPEGGGETFAEVALRLRRALARANQLAPGGCVALSTHAEVIIPGRMLEELLGLDDRRYELPLLANPPDGMPPEAQKACAISQAQIEIYKRRDSVSGRLSPRHTHFRSIGTVSLYDTGWVPIEEVAA